MTPAQIAIAAAEGYSVVCASCRHLHRARAARGGKPGPCGQSDCGGPLAGRTFPKYDGPITDFTRWCFMCGEPAKFAAMAKGSERVFGLCKEHVRSMEEFRARGTDGSERVIEEVKTPDGQIIHPDQLLGKRPRSLFAEIAKAEKEFAERDGS